MKNIKKRTNLAVIAVILAAFSISTFGQKQVPVKFKRNQTSTEIKSSGSNTFLVNMRKGQKYSAVAINESNCDSKMTGLMDVVDRNGVPGEEEAGYGAFSNNFKGVAAISGTYRFKIKAAKCARYRFVVSVEK